MPKLTTSLDILGQVPHGLVIQKVAPRIWFPFMTFVWALLTMVCGACSTFSHFAAVRFFQGIAEASTYSGTQYIIGSWYKGPEVGKRVGLFQASGMVGTMFAGILMTAIWKTMDGISDLPGWRWVSNGPSLYVHTLHYEQRYTNNDMLQSLLLLMV